MFSKNNLKYPPKNFSRNFERRQIWPRKTRKSSRKRHVLNCKKAASFCPESAAFATIGNEPGESKSGARSPEAGDAVIRKTRHSCCHLARQCFLTLWKRAENFICPSVLENHRVRFGHFSEGRSGRRPEPVPVSMTKRGNRAGPDLSIAPEKDEFLFE